MSDKMNKKDENREDGYLPEILGERIAFLRKRNGMTQAQLAEKLGISAQAVSKWESGLSCPDIMMLVPLSKIFGISTDVLLSGNRLYEYEPQQEKIPKSEEDPFLDENQGESGETVEVYKPVAYIHSLYIDLGAADAVIQEGNDFDLTVSGFKPGGCTSIVQNGVWKINDSGYKDIIYGLKNLFRDRKAVITVPYGFRFKDIHLSMGAGRMKSNSLITETSTLSIGAGEITMSEFQSGPSKMRCGMGSIKLDGELTGLCKMDCGMGKIYADITSMRDCGYDVNVGMGEVKIGDNNFSGMSGRHRINQGADNFFDITCGMGSVEVKFIP